MIEGVVDMCTMMEEGCQRKENYSRCFEPCATYLKGISQLKKMNKKEFVYEYMNQT